MERVRRSAPLAGVLSLIAAAASLLGATSPWLGLNPKLSDGCHFRSLTLPSISGLDLLNNQGLGFRFRLAAWLLIAGIALLALVCVAIAARRHLALDPCTLGASIVGSLLVGTAVWLATPPATSPGFCLSYSSGYGQTICVCAAFVGLVGSVLLARSMTFDRSADRLGDAVGAPQGDELTVR